MLEPIPSCFRGSAAGGPPSSTAAGPRLTTSAYDTHLGLAALTWSRTVLGLSLRIELRLSDAIAGEVLDPAGDDEEEPLRFRVRPWLFWKRRGSKRFHLREDHGHRAVDVAWDLTRARFPPGGGPEPCAGFFVAVAIDGEMLLAAGDMGEEAYKKTKAARPKWPWAAAPVLISRKEHVVLGEARSYKTRAILGGRDREMKIELDGAKETSMSVSIEGERVLQVRRLRWKFRGSERVEVEGGAQIQISWDLHNWLFQQAKEVADPEMGQVALFVFRFEREKGEGEEKKRGGGGGGEGFTYRSIGLNSGKSRNWSESSSGGGGGDRRGKGRKKSLLKTSSSSSSSSASSASSSSVMEWASPEETELRNADGFSLLVYAWKS